MALLGLGLALLPARGLRAAGVLSFSYKEVARLGMKTPAGGTLVNDFEPGRISAAGEVAFVADDDIGGNGGNSSEGLFLTTNGSVIPVVEPNQPVGPDAPDWTFVANGPVGMILSPVGMNAADDIAFGCDVQKKGDTDLHSGNFLWIRKTGEMVPVNLPGANAPDHGMFGDTHGSTWAVVNDQDDVAFAADVSDAQGNVAQGVFVRTGADGKVHTIARPGDKAPDGSTFTLVRRPNINNAGTVVFEGTTDKASTVGIYLSQNGKITPLVTPDTNIPGVGMLLEVKRPRLNNQGEVVFLGMTSAGWGIFSMSGNTLAPVIQPGAGLGDGTKLGQILDKDGSVALAASGDIALLGQRAADSSNAVYLLHGGQLVDVAPIGTNVPGAGTIDGLVNASGQFEHVALNSVGQVTFPATFKDGHTGLVLATPVP
jgi:hypothetical protein